MPRISYVNGQYIRHAQAAVHVEDRGYQFADAIYEVVIIVDGRMVDGDLHFERMERSLREIRIGMPFSRALFRMKIDELLRLNRLKSGALYIQVSRGVAPRDHRPPSGIVPSVVMTVRPLRAPPAALLEQGAAVISVADIRWKRPDIKSVGLLPNILAKDDAVRSGVYEAWQIDDAGFVTEGTSTNAWIVLGDRLVTHPPAAAILNGVTRLALLKIAAAEGLTVEERPFSIDEARSASEAFLTSTTAFIVPIVRIDDTTIGDGRPGPRTLALLAAYREHVRHVGAPG
ncbi:MAG: D-amino-acid transaminase [Rhodospirillaceae bacterium]